MPPRNARLARRTSDVLSDTPDEAVLDAEVAGSGRLFGLSDDFPRLLEVDLHKVSRNPDQPRKHFDQSELEGLAESIRKHGLQQPILVRSSGEGHYQIVAGERRYRAHELLGKPTIFALITTGDPDELALVENVQRVDLNALELAAGYRRLTERYGHTQAAIGAIVGRSQAEVSSVLNLLNLPEAVKREYFEHTSRVSRNTLVEVARGAGPEEQAKLWTLAKAGATLELVRQERQRGKVAPAAADGRSARRVATLLRQSAKSLGELASHHTQLGDEHRDQLREMRRAITAILGDEEPSS